MADRIWTWKSEQEGGLHAPVSLGVSPWSWIAGTYTAELRIISWPSAFLLSVVWYFAHGISWLGCKVRFNDPSSIPPHFSTGLIGGDNAIARHGIHGLYWLYSIDVASNLLQIGKNIIYLRQARSSTPFEGVMYDYLRLEGPPWTVICMFQIVIQQN